MSGSMNKVILVGNLGRDPEIRATQSGDKVANLNIATSESYRDRDGNRQTKTEWHRVVMFGKLAEIAEKYLNKGSKILVEGKLQTRKWQDAQGNDKYTTEIVVSGYNGTMTMLDQRGDNNTNAEQYHAGGGYDNAYGDDNQNNNNAQDFDDDIPF